MTVTQADLNALSVAHPNLNANGYGSSAFAPQPVRLDEVQAAYAWIAEQTWLTVPAESSYSLKHVMERVTGMHERCVHRRGAAACPGWPGGPAGRPEPGDRDQGGGVAGRRRQTRCAIAFTRQRGLRGRPGPWPGRRCLAPAVVLCRGVLWRS